MTETATRERIEDAQPIPEEIPAEEAAVAGEAETTEAPEAERLAAEEAAEGVAPPAEASAARSAEFLNNIEVEAAVELGRTQLTIGEVLALRPGSVVQLDKMLGDPAELMVKDRLIAKGEVVVVEDRFGVRITEVAAREEG